MTHETGSVSFGGQWGELNRDRKPIKYQLFRRNATSRNIGETPIEYKLEEEDIVYEDGASSNGATCGDVPTLWRRVICSTTATMGTRV